MNDSHALDGHEVPGPGHYDTTKMKPNARSVLGHDWSQILIKEQVSENPGPYVNISIVLQNNHSSKRIILLYTLIQIYQYTNTQKIKRSLSNSNQGTGNTTPLQMGRKLQNYSTKHACNNTILGKSKRWPKPTAASDVGPGKYQSNHTSFGKQDSSKLGTSSAIKFGTGPQRQIGKLDDCSVPYIAAPSMIGKGPKISMHFREKFGSTTLTKGNNPPGAYTPEDQPGRAGTSSWIRFR